MNFKAFLTFFELIPSIVALVKQAETLIPGQKQGPAKLNLVLDTVNAAVSSAPAVAEALQGNDLTKSVTAVVGATVNVLHTAGVFSK